MAGWCHPADSLEHAVRRGQRSTVEHRDRSGGANGSISIYNYLGSSAVTVDVQGYFTTANPGGAGGYTPVGPSRIANNYGWATGANIPQGYLAAGASVDIQATGVGGISEDATSLFVNIEVRDADAPGSFRVGPGSTGLSNYAVALDYGTSGVYDSGLTVKLNSAGKFRLTNVAGGGKVHIKVDVQGSFSGAAGAGGLLTATSPTWLTNTASSGPLQANETRLFQVEGKNSIPTTNVGSVIIDLTARNWTASGALTMYDPDRDDPGTLNASFYPDAGDPGNGVGSTAIVETSLGGMVAVHNTSTKPVDLTLVTMGWFSDYAGSVKSQERANEDDLPADAPPAAMTSYGVDENELTDLRDLAAQENISVQKAVDNYGWQDDVCDAVTQISENHPDSYSYAAVVDTPSGGTVAKVAFTQPAPADAKQELAQTGAPVTLVENAPYTDGQIQQLVSDAADAIDQQVDATTTTYTVDYSTETNEIEADIDDAGTSQSTSSDVTAAVMEALDDSSAAATSGPPAVDVDVADQELEPTYLGGGVAIGRYQFDDAYHLADCTTGFGAYDRESGRYGILLAGHCTYMDWYANLKRGGGRNATSAGKRTERKWGDLQFRPTKGEAVSKSIYYLPGKTRRMTGAGGVLLLGQRVCLFGRRTNGYIHGHRTCSKVTRTGRTVTYRNGVGRYDNLATVAGTETIPGDSGGPWYWGSHAWGIQSGYGNIGSDQVTYFAPVESAKRMGVVVNR